MWFVQLNNANNNLSAEYVFPRFGCNKGFDIFENRKRDLLLLNDSYNIKV